MSPDRELLQSAVSGGFITAEEAEQCLGAAVLHQRSVADVLVQRGLIAPEQVTKLRGTHLGDTRLEGPSSDSRVVVSDPHATFAADLSAGDSVPAAGDATFMHYSEAAAARTEPPRSEATAWIVVPATTPPETTPPEKVDPAPTHALPAEPPATAPVATRGAPVLPIAAGALALIVLCSGAYVLTRSAEPPPASAESAARSEGLETLTAALGRLRERKGFVVVEDGPSARSVQFSAGPGEPLLLDVFDLSSSEMRLVRGAFPGREPIVDRTSFQIDFGQELQAAAEAATAFMEAVYGARWPKITLTETAE